ncbi:TetR/AcrR family transcriptional regulator [Streptomyces sp. NPDC005408]|uniref:TetR/AcrR family transcriptional regulator n=1 Tax=Streptomyces sp. NPDC005408 TaxID=3155341 RepID=UPI00339FB152
MAEQSRVSAERRRRRPTRSGVVLTAEMIIERTLELLDAHGDEALTVRKLGAALGADPSAIYRYFRNIDDLLLSVADRLIGDALKGFTPGADWAAGLRDFALRVYRTALRHPRLATLSTARVTSRLHEYRAVDTGIGLLLQAGFDPAAAVRHYHVFIDTVLAHAALDAAVMRLTPEQREADARAWTDTYQQLPADEYPSLHAAREYLPAMADSAFENTLGLLLRALVAEAPGVRNNNAPES